MEHPLLEFCTTEKQRDIVMLCYVEGHSQQQAAVMLGSTRNAIKSSIRDIKSKSTEARLFTKSRLAKPRTRWT